MGSGSLTESLRETLALFDGHGEPRTTPEVAESLDLGRRSAYARLDRLVERERLETKKVGANARVWWRSPSTAAVDDAEPVLDSEQFEALVDAVEEYAIFALDADGRVRTWNSGAEQIKGYSDEDILGEHVSVFYTDDQRDDGVAQRNLDTAADRGSVQEEGWRVRADGTRFWANVTITAIRDADGTIHGYTKVTRDMTERRQYERRLQQERDLTDRLLETAPVRLAVFRADGSIERLNSLARRQLGLDDAAVSNASVDDIDLYDAGGEPIQRGEHPVWHAIETGEPVPERLVQHDGPDGDRRWVSLTVTPLIDDGDLERIVVAGNDVTDLKRTERQLESQRDELRAELDEVVDRISDGVVGVDDEWRITYLNDAAASLLDCPQEAAVDEELWDVFTDLRGTEFEDAYRTAMEAQEPTTVEAHYPPFDGWYRDVAYPSATGLSIHFQDVTERKQRERKLQQYERIVETADEGIYVLDSEHRFTMVNGGFASMTGYDRDELVGAHATTTFGDEFVEIADEKQAELESGELEIAVMEEDLYRKDGSSIVVESRFDAFEIGDDETGRVGVVRDVTDRVERERDLERRHEQLAALNSLNEVVTELTVAVIDQSTRGEIERVVCEHLADSESYRFAWIGDADASTQTVNVRTEAGVEGYLDGVTISVDPDDERSEGPTGRAIRTGEMQTTQDIESDSRHDPWREHVEAYGFRSSAAIPIVHEDTVYGALNVYAGRPAAFEGREGEMIAQLGDIVGHAVAAAEQKRALMSDELVELEFQIGNIFTALDVPVGSDETITLDDAVPVADDEFLVFGTAEGDAIDAVYSLAETIPHWEEVTVRSSSDPVDFELRLTEPPVLSSVASLGGYVEQAVIEDGTFQMKIHLAPTVDVRRVIDTVEATFPTVEMLRRRSITRPSDDPQRTQRLLVSDLTDRQSTALGAAYHAGFFEWPRDTSGEEVAESMGVAPPTFHQHLRKAQRKVFDSMFSTAESG